MAKEPEILTRDEAAELLRLSAYAVRDMARKGILPARKVGRGWRFYKPDVVEWLRTGRIPAQEAR
jgi:excisionase family DNA binding protein